MAITCWGTAPSLLRRLGLGLVVLLLAACAGESQMMDRLDQSLRGYEKAVRWAQFDTVYSFHKWDNGTPPAPPANMKNIRVTKYESSGQKYDPKEKVMKQTVTLRYYSTDSLRELTLRQEQEWKYFPDLKHWYLISDPLTFP